MEPASLSHVPGNLSPSLSVRSSPRDPKLLVFRTDKRVVLAVLEEMTNPDLVVPCLVGPPKEVRCRAKLDLVIFPIELIDCQSFPGKVVVERYLITDRVVKITKDAGQKMLFIRIQHPQPFCRGGVIIE